MLFASRLQVSAEPERQEFGGIDAFARRCSEVAGAIAIDHAGDASGLRVIALVSFKLFYVCSDTKKLCEVPAGGIACDANPVGIDLIDGGICLQPSNGGFDIENRRWELVFWGEAVTRRDRDIASLSELDQQRIVGIAVARAKAAAVNAEHTREQVIGLFRASDVKLQMLVVRIGILDFAFEQDVLRNIEVGRSSSKFHDYRAKERREDAF